jgi:hypothetical protein
MVKRRRHPRPRGEVTAGWCGTGWEQVLRHEKGIRLCVLFVLLMR